ncbi:MarR family winged helix-turn-helix transcriptional regulator [Propylenella binzhouense]|uniref:MarR family winged helix-turn-helix transcriptional regulator n=1 Tax=Propylenella binzhouense TaxID=2555902 RepID=UPI00136B967E|nr:MarR family transcriptional regulator [Propylenella binzhouense]
MELRATDREEARENVPEIGLGLLLRSANQAFGDAINANLAAFGVTRGQFNHLRRLWERDGMSSSELSALVGVKKATSTSILDSLESKKLIRRVRNDPDRRKVNVFLTEAGRALEQDLTECAKQANRQAARHFSEAEMLALYSLLRRLVKSLRESGPEPSAAAEAERSGHVA